MLKNDTRDQELRSAVETFAVMIQGVMDGMPFIMKYMIHKYLLKTLGITIG